MSSESCTLLNCINEKIKKLEKDFKKLCIQVKKVKKQEGPPYNFITDKSGQGYPLFFNYFDTLLPDNTVVYLTGTGSVFTLTNSTIVPDNYVITFNMSGTSGDISTTIKVNDGDVARITAIGTNGSFTEDGTMILSKKNADSDGNTIGSVTLSFDSDDKKWRAVYMYSIELL